MNTAIGLTLTQHDFSALREEAEGGLSKAVRDILENFDENQVSEFLQTENTRVYIGLDVATKLQRLADTYGTQPGRVARAIIEAHLLKRNHH